MDNCIVNKFENALLHSDPTTMGVSIVNYPPDFLIQLFRNWTACRPITIHIII